MARTRCRGDNHTMAAAARARDGRIVTAVNAHHFMGGPCAELVCIGAAAAQGAYELDTIVAVGDRVRTVRITDLLPESYVWADHQLEAEQAAPLSPK